MYSVALLSFIGTSVGWVGGNLLSFTLQAGRVYGPEPDDLTGNQAIADTIAKTAKVAAIISAAIGAVYPDKNLVIATGIIPGSLGVIAIGCCYLCRPARNEEALLLEV